MQGPTRFTVTQGERVRIVVRADVTDEVHLHGYDLLADVSPSDPARIDFVARRGRRLRGGARRRRRPCSSWRSFPDAPRDDPRRLLATWLLVTAAPAFAHGRSAGRRISRCPLWLFVFGAATALLISFVALSMLWTEPRFEGRPTRSARPSWLQSILTNHALEWAIRILDAPVLRRRGDGLGPAGERHRDDRAHRRLRVVLGGARDRPRAAREPVGDPLPVRHDRPTRRVRG